MCHRVAKLIVQIESSDGVSLSFGYSHEFDFHRFHLAVLASALSHLLSVLSFVYITIMVHSSLLAVLRFLQSGVLISNRWCKGTAVRILIKRMHFIKRLKDISSSDDSFYNL